MDFDVIIVGGGPGGYVAAIRARQLGLTVGVVEKEKLGGVCLNKGCIPTKALLKSASILNDIKHAKDFGISIDSEPVIDFNAMINRSREVADRMSKGVEYLFKKNEITVIRGLGKILPEKKVAIKDKEGAVKIYQGRHVIIATGARSKELPFIRQDGKNVFGYYEAMTLKEKPSSLVVIGSGAIGSEFASFYQSLGTQVTLIEYLPEVVPLEDAEVSKQLARSFKKMKMKVLTGAEVKSVECNDSECKVHVITKKGEQVLKAEKVLSAVGIATNIENLGLEEVGILQHQGKVEVDTFYQTSVEGYYAIGDIVAGPALAHVASAEALVCVEKIAGLNPEPINYDNIPSAVYTSPEVASVGINEQVAIEQGLEYRVGKFPFMASGKAQASGNKDGFIKVIIDKKTDEILGAHMIGDHVTEMIAELVAVRKAGLKGKEVLSVIHPHPTMSEAIMEAFADAYGEAIHL